MLHETSKRHFELSGFAEPQAEALADMISEILSQFATKHDLELLEARFENKLQSEISTVRSEINALRNEMTGMKADLTWRFIALTAFLATFLGTVLSVINILLA